MKQIDWAQRKVLEGGGRLNKIINQHIASGNDFDVILYSMFKFLLICPTCGVGKKFTYHAFTQKHVPRYLAEFQYRFNHRFHLPSMVQDLIQISLATPPMPERLLTLAEKWW